MHRNTMAQEGPLPQGCRLQHTEVDKDTAAKHAARLASNTAKTYRESLGPMCLTQVHTCLPWPAVPPGSWPASFPDPPPKYTHTLKLILLPGNSSCRSSTACQQRSLLRPMPMTCELTSSHLEELRHQVLPRHPPTFTYSERMIS